MRIESLTLRGFGSWLQESVIPFAELGKLFLICGNTGAGKTTLFDAMCWALYGSLPGSRDRAARLDTGLEPFRHRDLESTEPLRVALVFEQGSLRYQLERKGKFLRPKRGGGMIEEPASLELLREGQKVNLREGPHSQPGEEVLGLSKDEFCMLVLLPQGAFQAFLHARTKEKEEILGKLFPLDSQTRFCEFVHAQRMQLEKDALTKSSALNEVDPGPDARQRLDTMEALETAHRSTLGAIDASIVVIREQQRKAREQADTDAEATKLEFALSQLAETWAEVEALSAEASRVEMADRLTRPWEAYRSAVQERERGQKRHDAAQLRLSHSVEAVEALARTATPPTEFERKIRELDEARKNLIQELQVASVRKEREAALVAAQRACDEAAAQQTKLRTRIGELEGELAAVKDSARLTAGTLDQGATERWAERYAEAQKAASLLSRRQMLEAQIGVAEKAHAQVLRRYTEVAEARARLMNEAAAYWSAALATDLKPDSPCPVCGSLSHPSPAHVGAPTTARGGTSQIEVQLEKARSELAAHEGEINRMRGSLAELVLPLVEEDVESLEKLARSLDELRETRRKLQAREESLDAEGARLRQLAKEADSVRAQKDLEVGMAQERLESLPPSVNKDAEAALDACKKEIAALEATREREASQKRAAELEQSAARESVAQSTKDLSERADMEVAAANEWRVACEGKFANDAEFLERYEKRDQLGSMKARVDRAQQQRRELSGKLDLLRSRPREDYDLEELESEFTRLTQVLKETRASLDALIGERSLLEQQYQRANSLREEYQRIISSLGVISRLDVMLRGESRFKVRFQTFLQRRFLERIVIFANRRLQQLRGGRYALVVDRLGEGGQEKTGLDLLIEDRYLGCTRDVLTLSGGETFIVSLSLALGMADAVAARVEKRRLESLFIDEGFGSLDPQALDEAIRILEECGEGRTIGIISHVQELVERVPVRLEVSQEEGRSHATIATGQSMA